jgi:hypothetical protein
VVVVAIRSRTLTLPRKVEGTTRRDGLGVSYDLTAPGTFSTYSLNQPLSLRTVLSHLTFKRIHIHSRVTGAIQNLV